MPTGVKSVKTGLVNLPLQDAAVGVACANDNTVIVLPHEGADPKPNNIKVNLAQDLACCRLEDPAAQIHAGSGDQLPIWAKLYYQDGIRVA